MFSRLIESAFYQLVLLFFLLFFLLFLSFDYKEGINATCQIAYLSTLLISPNPSLHP